MTAYKNWREDKAWQSGSVGNKLHQPYYAALIGLVVVSFFSVVIYLNLDHKLHKNWQLLLDGQLPGFNEGLIPVPFFLINLFVLHAVYKTHKAWKRFGKVRIRLDPFPGAIGGDVGGSFSLPLAYHAQREVRVSVNCLSVRISKSSNRSSRHESVKWRDEAIVETFAGAGSTSVRFLCPVPDRLPETTQEQGSGSIIWAIRVEVPEEGFDQDFILPVLKDAGPDKSSILIRQSVRGFSERLSEIPHSVALISEATNSLSILYPPGREAGISKIFTLIGLLLLGVGLFMATLFYNEVSSERVSYFSAMIELIIATGFTLFGVLLVSAGFYMLKNQLRIDFNHDSVTAERKIFFWSQRSITAREDILGFFKKVSSQSGQGAKSAIHYTLWMVTRDQKRVAVGDGIPGQEYAESLLALLNRQMGLPDDHTVDFSLQKRPLPDWALWLLPLFKVIGNVIFIAVIAAFVFDFL